MYSEVRQGTSHQFLFPFPQLCRGRICSSVDLGKPQQFPPFLKLRMFTFFLKWSAFQPLAAYLNFLHHYCALGLTEHRHWSCGCWSARPGSKGVMGEEGIQTGSTGQRDDHCPGKMEQHHETESQFSARCAVESLHTVCFWNSPLNISRQQLTMITKRMTNETRQGVISHIYAVHSMPRHKCIPHDWHSQLWPFRDRLR